MIIILVKRVLKNTKRAGKNNNSLSLPYDHSLAMKKTEFIECKVKDIIPETDDSVSVYFEIPEKHISDFAYEPGQYLTLKKKLKGEEIRRSYSLSSVPGKQWRIGVKKVPSGIFSTFINNRLTVGESIEVMPPQGNFLLDSESQLPYFVFFAAGSGITPILSMITHLLENTDKKVILFFGNKSVDKIMYREELEGMKNRFLDRFSIYYIFSQEKMGSPFFMGHIDSKKCIDFHQVLIEKEEVAQYLICGPSPMIFNIEETLLEMGVDKGKIKYELFTTADLEPGQPETDNEPNEKELLVGFSTVKIKLDGIISEIQVPFDGEAIVEVAEKSGLDVPYSCKGGVCSTCKAKLRLGKVRMDVNYALEEDEVEEGYVLSCQSHPITEEIFIDYDEA